MTHHPQNGDDSSVLAGIRANIPARRYPGFAEYERQTAGIRTIPVLELTAV